MANKAIAATTGARYGHPIEIITPVKHPIEENFVAIFIPFFNLRFAFPSLFLPNVSRDNSISF